MKSVIASLLMLLSSLPAFAGPRVEVVIGEKPPALERLAADELADQLKRVYEADVKIGSTVPADAPHVIFVGSPDTNAGMKPFAASWPSGDKKLTDQGHLLRSVTHNNKPALLIGGGSPVATYWAVSEFGHRLGIRSLLFGDLDPATPPDFSLDGINLLMEPLQRIRCWQFSMFEPTDAGAWGAAEFRQVLRQLARLKFNRVSIAVDVGAPFVHFEFAGVKRDSASFWRREQYNVSGDTSGRKVFGGAKVFENPHFVDAGRYEELIKAGTGLLTEVIEAAHEVGLSIGIQIPATQFPVTFRSMTGDSQGQGEVFATNVIPLDKFSRSSAISGLPRAQIQAFLDTYPKLDHLELSEMGSHPKEVSDAQLDTLKQVLSDLSFGKSPVGHRQEVWLKHSDSSGMVTRLEFNAKPNSDFNQRISSFSLNRRWDLLPFGHSDLAAKFHRGSDLARDGFCVEAAGIGDFDIAAYWLSRVSFDNSLTLHNATKHLLDPICGSDVSDRVIVAFGWLEQPQWKLIDSFGARRSYGAITYYELDLIERSAGEKFGESWASVTGLYLNAMNEMYRANTRAREGGRAFTLYWARRCEFAFEYMNCIEAVRKAGIAARKNDTATQIAELEKAVESLNNGLNAMAAVARSNSDRGLIAVLNKNGYRSLKKKLAAAEKGAK